MSIGSEVADLEQNLEAAQQAIIEKGGTVSGGLKNMATEIEALPTGGSITIDASLSLTSTNAVENQAIAKAMVEGDFGSVTYYDWSLSASAVSGYQCTVNSFDGKKLIAFLLQDCGLTNLFHVDFTWNTSKQQWSMTDEMTFTTKYFTDEEFQEKSSIQVTHDTSSSCSVNINVEDSYITIDTSKTYTTKLTRARDLKALTFLSSFSPVGLGFDNAILYRGCIVSYIWGRDIEKLPNNFLSYCSNLQMVNADGWAFPGTEIGDYFCRGCTGMITMALSNMSGSLRKVGSYFCAGCTALAGTELNSNLEEIGDNFLDGCTNLQSSTMMMPKLKVIGRYFMNGCTKFNPSSAITLPMVTFIAGGFLYGCSSFNCDISFSRALMNLRTNNFLYGCNSMVSTINFGSLSPSEAGVSTAEYGAFSTGSSSAASYTSGIKIAGDKADEWLAMFPNRTTLPYRKLINGNE